MAKRQLEDDRLLRTPENPKVLTREEVETLTVGQLRSKLKSLKLPVYGCKRALCQRLLMRTSPEIPCSLSQSSLSLFDPTLSQHSALDTSTQSSIAECKLIDLRQRCKDAGLPSAGRKRELVDRLEAYYEREMLSDLLDPELALSCDVDLGKTKPGDSFNSASVQSIGPFWKTCLIPPGPQIDPYSIQTVEELKTLNLGSLKQVSRTLGLPLYGKKHEVLERIVEKLSSLRESMFYKSFHKNEPVVSRKRIKLDNDEQIKLPEVSPTSARPRLRLRSNSKLSGNMFDVVEVETNNLNGRLEEPLSKKFFVFSVDVKSNYFQCSLCCENDNEEAPFIVTISIQPSCTCSSFEKDKVICKHILFVYLRMLKFDTADPIITKRILKTVELNHILKSLKTLMKQVRHCKPALKRVPISTEVCKDTFEVTRENWVDSVCGVCFEFLNSSSSMIWCRVQCGKNLHRQCFETWNKHFSCDQNKNRCPYCSSEWPSIPKNTRFQSKQTSSKVIVEHVE